MKRIVSTMKIFRKSEFLILAAIIIGGFLYVYNTWNRNKNNQRAEVLQVARTAKASLPLYLLDSLNATSDDTLNPSYKLLKERLISLVSANPEVSFAYLFSQKEGRIYFYADSELESSEDYSPPGQEFSEAQQEDRQPFIDGMEKITDPLTDRWGTWVTVYIPVLDRSGKVTSVFGMDFDAKTWNYFLLRDVFRSVLLVFLIILAWFFQYRIVIKNRSLKKMFEATIKADKDLQVSEARIRSITDSANDAILMIDHHGNVSYWNPAAEKIFGYTKEEVFGKNLHNLIAPEKYRESYEKAFPEFLKSGKGSAIGKTLDLEAVKKDGTVISVQLSLSSINIDGNWNAIGIMRDTTEQKRIEEALIKAKQESEAANKAKSIFLSNMSHEIRTPLNAIIGFSQLMKRDINLSNQQKEYNTAIIRAGEHLLELINEILELSKIEAGRIVLNPTSIDLHALCDDIYMMFRERANDKHLQLIFENSDDLPKYIMVDEGKLRQLFVNIIGNAIKFTDEGGIAVRTQIACSDGDKSFLIVEIQDSGPGIPEEEIGKLFRHFEQTSTGIKKGTGTGLGLALSKELALLMGGDITVSSKVGEGSVFTFKVEFSAGNENEIEIHDTKRVVSIADKTKIYKILVVDDKIENLQVAVTLLQLVGFNTEEAVDGKQAIEKVTLSKPDLILMDMRMPVMDGYEATRIIKTMDDVKDIPIVALTASTFEDERKRIEALKMQGYIRKPFRESDLFSTVGKILNISYIYEDEPQEIVPSNNDNETTLSEEQINKLPASFIKEMQDAISVADIDMVISLISDIEKDCPALSCKLREMANKYEYGQIEELLQKREEKR
ncbi:MAG: PAS domain S-box protein [Bacteroidales bacterium]|nr:PAS domain S-box protein [Bacteroidales bacterium]